MKNYPVGAEEIQEAAAVCSRCRRDSYPSGTTPKTRPVASRPLSGWSVGVILGAVLALTIFNANLKDPAGAAYPGITQTTRAYPEFDHNKIPGILREYGKVYVETDGLIKEIESAPPALVLVMSMTFFRGGVRAVFPRSAALRLAALEPGQHVDVVCRLSEVDLEYGLLNHGGEEVLEWVDTTDCRLK